MVGIFARMQMPSNIDFLFGLSGAKRFFFEMLIQSAELTNAECVSIVEQGLSRYKRHLEFDNIFEFLESKRIKIKEINTEKGFIVDAYLELMKHEAYEPGSVIAISDGVLLAKRNKKFSSGRGLELEVFHKDNSIKIGIKFSVQAQEDVSYPLTTMEFYDVSHSKQYQ